MFFETVVAGQATKLAASTMLHHRYTNATAIAELRKWYESRNENAAFPLSTNNPDFPFFGFLPLALQKLAYRLRGKSATHTWEDAWGAFDTSDLSQEERTLLFSAAMKEGDLSIGGTSVNFPH